MVQKFQKRSHNSDKFRHSNSSFAATTTSIFFYQGLSRDFQTREGRIN